MSHPKTNFNRLIAHKMSLDAIPPGTTDGLMAGVRFLSDKDALVNSSREAKEWVSAAITAVRLAADPNPWRNSTDEEIAGEILAKIAERKAQQGPR